MNQILSWIVRPLISRSISRFYYILRYCFLILATLDFLLTYFGVYVFEVSKELNPLINMIGPLPFYILNIIFFIFTRKRTYFNVSLVGFWSFVYLLLFINHFIIFQTTGLTHLFWKGLGY